MNNYYQLLGIRQDASTEEIEKRCLELGEQLRPDAPGNDAFAQQRFDEIERAYVTLTNLENRAAYDAILIAGEKQAGQLPSVAEADGKPSGMRSAWIRYAVIASSLAGWAIISWFLWALPSMRRPFTDTDTPRPVAQARIDPNCSVNGYGRVSCSFTNFGNAKGSTCIQIHLSSIFSKVIADRIVSETFCSGLIEPSDVRDRATSILFYDSNRQRVEPYKYCTEGAIRDAWPGQCKMTVVKVSEN